MSISFVLRLVGDRLSRGEFVGQAEHVGTGTCEVIADLDELIAFLQRSHVAATSAGVDEGEQEG